MLIFVKKEKMGIKIRPISLNRALFSYPKYQNKRKIYDQIFLSGPAPQPALYNIFRALLLPSPKVSESVQRYRANRGYIPKQHCLVLHPMTCWRLESAWNLVPSTSTITLYLEPHWSEGTSASRPNFRVWLEK